MVKTGNVSDVVSVLAPGADWRLPRSDSLDGLSFVTPLALDPDFSDKPFEVHLLIKKNVRENEIVIVNDKSLDGRRIGWCIPINALDSRDHDFSENSHFLRYAYKGIECLLASDVSSVFLNPEKSSTGYPMKFSDIFHPYTCLLVISRETLSSPDYFELDRYMPSLISYGYLKLTDRNPDEMAWTVPSGDKKLSSIALGRVSAELRDADIIVSLMQTAIGFEVRSIFRFFYAYQVIEMLMEEVFMAEQSSILSEYRDSVEDLSGAKEVIEKLQRITSEKKRLGLLIDEYSDCSRDLDDLRLSCKAFLGSVGRPAGDDFKTYFYGTRNYIFHQLRDLDYDKEELLSGVIMDFMNFLPNLLGSYRGKSFTTAGLGLS